MSALGRKQTFAVQNVMSALPPRADMALRLANRRALPSPRWRRDAILRSGEASLCPAAKILFSRGAHDFVRFGRDAEPPQARQSLPTLAVCAVLGLFAACVQRL